MRHVATAHMHVQVAAQLEAQMASQRVRPENEAVGGVWGLGSAKLVLLTQAVQLLEAAADACVRHVPLEYSPACAAAHH
jgi:hypothetical protein